LPSIIVHGGAGRYSPGEEHERGLTDAVHAGSARLEAGDSALDAVVDAIVVMEDFPIFQAGFGSSMNLLGEIQTDASIMLDDLSCGAVAALTAAANPIKAARLVMERTDHVLLVGEGADDFACAMGLESRDLRSDARKELYEKTLAKLHAGEEIRFLPRLGDLMADLSVGTVGAVAIDAHGRLAAGTSTGGPMLKLRGRVGDAAIIGAGTYANEHGSVSATGLGEPIMRYVLAKAAVDAIGEVGAREGIEHVLELARAKGVEFGIVGIEENGFIAHGFTTEAMSWATMKDRELTTFLSAVPAGQSTTKRKSAAKTGAAGGRKKAGTVRSGKSKKRKGKSDSGELLET